MSGHGFEIVLLSMSGPNSPRFGAVTSASWEVRCSCGHGEHFSESGGYCWGPQLEACPRCGAGKRQKSPRTLAAEAEERQEAERRREQENAAAAAAIRAARKQEEERLAAAAMKRKAVEKKEEEQKAAEQRRRHKKAIAGQQLLALAMAGQVPGPSGKPKAAVAKARKA